MTEIRGQRSEVINRRVDIMSGDAGYAERFLCVLSAKVVKPISISDLRLLISGLCALPFALSLLCAVLFAFCTSAAAQQPGRVPRIGYLVISSFSGSASRAEAFRQGLRELGYVEGKNTVIEWRYGDAKRDSTMAIPGI